MLVTNYYLDLYSKVVVVSIQTGAQKTRQLSCRLKIWSSERLLECNRS